ncbi:CD209 antigen-like protein C [Hemiscyllium ocellatum]|uniref:CD209 antigen-like protein C n=1 Tax=Hemiscyllium ocellatum TaxID=170820 RepID=UPI002965E1F3|nr:CD209 antigen-like protein C [Hemiscyllium ocellatum]XP_060711158.1 CD209 antigen-like protein C [Hemiscyllium ocellatum]XP_060711171.1 CD209 antigen-like protein C [Hemiscyllium ocellatum]
MELKDHYQNIDEVYCNQPRRVHGKAKSMKSEHGVRSADPVRRKWSPLVISIFLVLSSLLSMVILGTSIVLFSQLFSEMKASHTDFRMDFTQLKDNVSQLFSEMKASHTDFRMDFTQLKDNGTSEATRNSLTQLKMEISQLKETLSHFQCIEGWSQSKQKLYYFSRHLANWEDAQRFCKFIDADLVVINSSEEKEYLQMKMKHTHWIGLHDTVEEGKWRWVDETDYGSNVKFWRSGQPNGNRKENCATMSSEGKWDDWPCNSMHRSICEKSV